MIIAGFPILLLRADEVEYVKHVSGEITWIDLKLGQLQLERDQTPSTGEITEYRISEHETRVTNPTDEKFLSVVDLQPGQHVIVDVVEGKEAEVVSKITADPRPESEFQQAFGEVESIDGAAGTLVVAVKHAMGTQQENTMAYFVFEPSTIVVMQSPNKQSVTLILKQGDVVKVDYVLLNGKKQARYITSYAPRVSSTTTTTTTIITR